MIEKRFIYLVNNLVQSKIYCKYKLPFLSHMRHDLNNEGGIGILACSLMNNHHLATQLCSNICLIHRYRGQNSFYPYSPLKTKIYLYNRITNLKNRSTFVTIIPFPSLLALTYAIFTITVSRTIRYSAICFWYVTFCTFPTFLTMTKASTVFAVVRTQHRTYTLMDFSFIN